MARFEEPGSRMRRERGHGLFDHKDNADTFAGTGRNLFIRGKKRQ